MASELTKDWLLLVWNSRPGVLLRKQGMLVLSEFKIHLTPKVKAVVTICSMSTDLVVVLGVLSQSCKW